LILVANQDLDTPLAFAALLVLSVAGFLLYGMIELAERLLIPWSASVHHYLEAEQA
jgi:NitT/TauT family transport system permease protein